MGNPLDGSPVLASGNAAVLDWHGGHLYPFAYGVLT